MPPRKNSLQLPTAALSASGKGSKLITSSQPASTSSPAFNQQDITREVQTTRREIKPACLFNFNIFDGNLKNKKSFRRRTVVVFLKFLVFFVHFFFYAYIFDF